MGARPAGSSPRDKDTRAGRRSDPLNVSYRRTNVAVTEMARAIAKVQRARDPSQAPVHRMNLHPVRGSA
jgi:hypothetical protein